MADPRFVGNAIERFHGRTGTPFASDMHRDYVQIFRVITTDRTLGANPVCQAPGIPKPYAPYITDDAGDFDLRARAIHFKAEKADPDEPHVWDVTVQYSTRMPGGGPHAPGDVGLGFDFGGAQENPELIPPVLRWDKEIITRAPARDLDGLPFTISNGQPMTPAPTVEAARAVLVIIRNELTFDRETATSYAFAVNHAPFLGVPAACVRCDPPTADEEWIGDLHYWRVTYRLVFGAQKLSQPPGVAFDFLGPIGPAELADDGIETWDPEYLNQSTMQKNPFVGVGPDVVPIIKHAVPVSYPVLLDANGFVALRALNGLYTPTYTKRRIYKRRDFTDLIRGFNGRA